MKSQVMRIAIIGAGRNRNGIGEYIGKYFHKNGAQVVSVLGTTERTSEHAASSLRKYGIDSRPYTDFDQMVKKERPDAVAIASPSSTHDEYLARCIEAGLHILCEKPFIWRDLDGLARRTEGILARAGDKNLTVAMNSQWPFAINDYQEICGKIEIRPWNTFFIHQSPYSSGKEMIPESVPHALSLLYSVFGTGEVYDLSYEWVGAEGMMIRFRYLFEEKECYVIIELIKKEVQPREFQFGFNGKMATRRLNLERYDISFFHGERERRIADPLERSIQDFLAAVERRKEPAIGASHILTNMSLLGKIYQGCLEM
jgi:predicted dehydrogenase